MRVKLYEAVWKHHIENPLASEFHHAIDEADLEEVKRLSIEVLEQCKGFFDPEEDDYVIFDLDDMIENFRDVEDDEDEIDFLLSELYDFCDGYNIFIDVVEEPAEPMEEPEVPAEPSEEEVVELETAEEEK